MVGPSVFIWVLHLSFYSHTELWRQRWEHPAQIKYHNKTWSYSCSPREEAETEHTHLWKSISQFLYQISRPCCRGVDGRGSCQSQTGHRLQSWESIQQILPQGAALGWEADRSVEKSPPGCSGVPAAPQIPSHGPSGSSFHPASAGGAQ